MTEAMSELVTYRVEDAIATITLDSPANRNALSAALVEQLAAHLANAGADEGIRAIVLTHTGSTFCAGNDLREAREDGGPERGTIRLIALLRQLIELPKPVIARVDGHARAGGVGLIGASDIALASSAATFSFTEVRLGLAPAMISLTTLTRLSERAASRYYLTGEVFDSVVAERIGLLTEFAPDLDAALTVVLQALRLASPQGLAHTKPLTTRAIRAAFDAQAAELQALSSRLFASEEGREGMRAILEKRPPRWVQPN
jgi:enoyl-CoA hydratase